MLQLGTESFERHPREDRAVMGLSVSLSKQRFEAVQERINQMRQELFELMISEDTHVPYVTTQVNFIYFPLSQKRKAS